MTTSFEKLRKARERRRAARRSALLTSLLAVPALAGVAVFSPLMDVDTVRVGGTKRLAPRAVEDAARVGDGPLATLDTDAVRRRVESIRGVKSATVRREWPATVVLRVVERVPVVAVPRGTTIDLYDIEGVLVDSVASAPATTPRLAVPVGSPTPEVIGAAVALLRALPPVLRRDVRDLKADGPASLSFHLADGAEVVWGSGERTAEKVRALRLLVRQKAKRYDLRVPDRPAVVPR